MKKLLSCIAFTAVFVVAAHAHAAVYYFNNAVNTDPTELGNYWNDGNTTDPALSLPDTAVDEITVLAGTTYVGNAVFNGEARNEGTVSGDAVFKNSSINNGIVTGDAMFYEDTTINNGTVNGAKIRRYTIATESGQDFSTDGPWTVIADGVQVSLVFSLIDETTTLQTIGQGYFVYATVQKIRFYKHTITLSFTKDIDVSSVPDNGDFAVTVNGAPATVTGVSIASNTVLITLAQDYGPDDVLSISYTRGTHPIQSSLSQIPVQDIQNQTGLFVIPVTNGPSVFTSVASTLYISSLSGNQPIEVLDTTTNTVLQHITGTLGGYAVSNNGYLYVANTSNQLIVIDLANNTIVATISLGHQGGTISIVGKYLYIINSDNTVSVVDTETNTLSTTIMGIPSDFAYSGAVIGKKLFINSVNGTTTVIDSVDNTYSGIATGSTSYSILVWGTKIYVPNYSDQTMAIVDYNTNTVHTVATGVGPRAMIGHNKKVYIINDTDNTVNIFDADTDDLLKTISIGAGAQRAIIVGDKIYISNTSDNSISIIDTHTDTVVDTIPVGTSPGALGFLYNNVYVGNGDRSISIINTQTIPSQLPNLVSFSTSSPSGTYTPSQSIPIQAHFGRTLSAGSTMTVLLNTGRSVTLSSVSGSTLSGTYVIQTGDTTPDLAVRSITSASVSDTNGHTRLVYDLPSSVGTFTAENSFITRNLGDSVNIQIGDYQSFDTGSNPYQISVPINGFLYVANQGAGTVSVINATTGALTDTISVGSEPYGLAVNGTELYVANTGSDTVSVINTATNTVTHTISVGVKPYYVATIGTNIYVTNGASNTVSVISTLSHTVTNTISVGSYPRGIKAHGTDLYVANYGDPNYSGGNYISVISSLTNTVTDTIILPAGSDGPRGVTSLGSNVYVTNFRSNNVSVIDTATNTITATIPVGMGPRGIIGSGTTLYVENFDDGTISIIDTNSNTVTDTVDVGHSPAGMSISGTNLYVTSFQDDKMYILDTTTDTLRTTDSVSEPAPATTTPSRGPSGWYAKPVVISTTTTGSIDCPVGYAFSSVTGAPCSGGTAVVPNQTLKWKSTGPAVMYLQQYLNTHKFPVAPSGIGSLGKETHYFGIATRSAVLKFQKAKGLKADGIVGKGTWSVIAKNL